MISINTISNSWIASERLHEPVRLPCVFGCQGCKDHLIHYLQCEPFWTLIISALNMHQSWLSCPPASKLCIANINSQNLYLIGIAFKTYHAIIKCFEDLIGQAVATQDFHEVHLKATFLARHFGSECRMT